MYCHRLQKTVMDRYVWMTQWVQSRSEWVVYNPCLQPAREADQVGADTERGALACRNAHAGADGVEDGKDDRRQEGERGNLVHGEGLAGDEQCCGSDHETLNQVLDDTVDDFGDSGVHGIYSLLRKKIA